MIDLNKKSGNVTIYDVAKEANVSVSTVSKILNNSEHKFKEETKAMVFETAEKLGYERLDSIISNDKKGSNKIAAIIPDIINPYYASLANGLENALRASGMEMIFHNSHNSRELEISIANQLIKSDCSGAIIISICESYNHIKELIDAGIKVVAFEQYVDLDCNKVGFNYSKGGFMATEFLIKNGYSKIGFISSPLSRKSRLQVFDGYKKALAKNDVEFNENLVKLAASEDRNADIMYDYENGIEQVDMMIKEKQLPEAIFCINDMTAIGVIRKLQDEGYNVPNDISVIGFDNINFSYVIRPELTTIEQSTYELGAMAAEILIGSINDSNRGNISIVLEPKLIVRESVLIKK